MIQQTIHTPSYEGEVFAYSCRGKTHEIGDVNNQDSYGFFNNEDVLAIAVADGVSSCKNAADGSFAAVLIVQSLSSALYRKSPLTDQKIKDFIITQWKARYPTNANDYGTTLRFVLIQSDEAIIGHIGDGCTLLKTEDRCSDFSGESIFANCTYALCANIDPDNFSIIRLKVSGSVLAVLTTDGISLEIDPAQKQPFVKYIEHIMLENPDYAEEIVGWVDGLQEKNGDDKTIVALRLSER